MCEECECESNHSWIEHVCIMLCVVAICAGLTYCGTHQDCRNFDNSEERIACLENRL